MKIAIFLGAGASAAEHCPIQSQLFFEYFTIKRPIFSSFNSSFIVNELNNKGMKIIK